MANPPEFGMRGVAVRFTAESLKPETIIAWLEYQGDDCMDRANPEPDHAARCYRSAWDLTFIWAGYGEARERLAVKMASMVPAPSDRLIRLDERET